MIPTTQTILHDPENGINGNCLSAVLASLLHVDIDDVPVFCNEVSWVKDLNAWLRQFGLAYVQCHSFQEQCEASGIEGCYCEVFGDSPRRPGTLHATVGLDGAMIFDPHPDRSGVVGDPVSGLFVSLRPWQQWEAEKRANDLAALATEMAGMLAHDRALPDGCKACAMQRRLAALGVAA